MIRRHLHAGILGSLRHFPVVLVTGARQVGKSTLAQAVAQGDWPARYLTLDDRAVLDAALKDPDGFIAGTPTPLVLDEVQRAPDLLRAIKLTVDRNRKPGQYLLTGSANLMTLRTVSESLAGRLALHELHPFSWSELARAKPPTTLRDIFEAKDARALLSRWSAKVSPRRRREIEHLILTGGFPTPALLKSAGARQEWFATYRQTYIERDLRDLATVEHLPDFNRLLALLALRTGQLLNYSDLSRDLGLPLTTLRRYMSLLELTYQMFLLRPYFANVGKRLVKTPKVYLGDTGMACHLAVADTWMVLERQGRAGAVVETWVAAELRKLIAATDPRLQLWYWRPHAGREVDFLIERGDALVAVEVKWTQRITERDTAGLRQCAQDLKGAVRLGLLLYPGSETVALDRHTLAVPFSTFFGIEGR
ncbi:MAG: hypothetical protein A3H39_06410 [candidate division NC10 bacterium RIFCSPLOWO2_02_FULL_66_22]|nr:MAG: hypothetical protein A3H39_06410 [candidate division NC10 bacterium RIFCSPLOWO2_02_FULL_66_22]